MVYSEKYLIKFYNNEGIFYYRVEKIFENCIDEYIALLKSCYLLDEICVSKIEGISISHTLVVNMPLSFLYCFWHIGNLKPDYNICKNLTEQLAKNLIEINKERTDYIFKDFSENYKRYILESKIYSVIE